MPRATVANSKERYELQSLKDAYVIIRRMNYGEKLDRQDDMINMRTGGANTEGNSGGFNAEIKLMNKKVALSDFANLIVEHNLTDDNEQLLNFKNPMHVMALDPIVGDEIGQLIDKLNSFEGDIDLKNS